MDELGIILRETREARGLTLEDVAQVTRIRVRYLEALEDGRYDVLPTPVHVRGFLRNYAQYLNLDPAPLVARYNASRRAVQDIPLAKQVRPERDRVPVPPPETLADQVQSEPVFYRPAGVSLRAPAWFSTDILIGLLILVILAAFAIWAGSRFVIPALTGARATETPIAQASRAVPSVPAASGAGPTRTSTPTPPTQQPTRPPIYSSIQLQVTVKERSWLSVVVDGETVQEGMARPGDLFAWDGLDTVKLRTGNGAGIAVTLNGQELGPLGERGQVIEKIWGLSGEIAPTPTLTPMPSQTPLATPTEPPAPTPTPAG